MCLIVHGHIKLTSRSRYVQIATLAGLEPPVAFFDHVCFGRRKSFRILLAIDEPFVFRLQIRACVRILSKIEAHATALQDHSMAVHVVSASPSAAPCGIGLSFSVALVVHVLHVDDGLFACSGSIAVDTLRTEQRNVDRRAKRISVPVLTPCQRISVPQDQMKSPESAKSFMLYVPFRGI